MSQQFSLVVHCKDESIFQVLHVIKANFFPAQEIRLQI